MQSPLWTCACSPAPARPARSSPPPTSPPLPRSARGWRRWTSRLERRNKPVKSMMIFTPVYICNICSPRQIYLNLNYTLVWLAFVWSVLSEHATFAFHCYRATFLNPSTWDLPHMASSTLGKYLRQLSLTITLVSVIPPELKNKHHERSFFLAKEYKSDIVTAAWFFTLGVN